MCVSGKWEFMLRNSYENCLDFPPRCDTVAEKTTSTYRHVQQAENMSYYEFKEGFGTPYSGSNDLCRATLCRNN